LAAAAALVLAGASIQAASPVADAAMKGDTDAVRTLVKQGADVNAAQADGMTALHWAAVNGDVKMMDILIVAGASTESLTRVGAYTPLHLASSRGHAPAVMRLLEAGSKPKAVTATGAQAIHLAAQAGSADAVRFLIDKGADPNVRDNTHGRTPLVFAASQNRIEAMRMLIEKGANSRLETTVIDYPKRQAEDNAARVARDRLITATTGKAPVAPPQFDPPQTGRAASTGQDPAAAAAGAGVGGGRGGGRGGAAAGPRPISDIQQIGKQGGLTALHYVARDGYMDAAMMLIDSGMDVNVPTAGDRSTPLLVACVNGNFDLAMAFLKRGANPNLVSDDGAGPLFAVLNNEWALRTWYPQPTAAAQQRTSHLELMEALLKAGADPNARTVSHIWYAAYNAGRMGVDYTGITPFWRAAYSLDVDAMRMLVKYGADPNIPSMSYGAAARNGHPAVPSGGPHVPPFHAASGVGYGTSRVAQQHRHVPDGWMPAAKYFLEELGVDVNMRDADGFTALHHAAARGDNTMILYLVKRGADVMAVNRNGQTTVDMANSPEQRTQPFPETIKLLEGMGAKNNHNCQACK
jgi:uncharacterized protein